MSVRRIGALLAVVVLAACSGGSSSSVLHESEGPGGLLTSEELEAPAIDGTVWSVTYRSQSVGGDAVEVTGLVAQPSSGPPPGGYPVLSWAHGTTGIADDCAPSVAEGPESIPGLQAYLDAGYVVAATDYEGLGGSGVHPYLVSESEARSVLDAARAATDLVPDAGRALLVAGHSQGGHAALAAAETAADWAPELDLLGTVAIAPVADLALVVPGIFTAPVAGGLAVMVAAGWAGAYDELDVGDVLGPPGVELAERAADDLCASDVFAEATGIEHGQLITAQPRELGPWDERVRANTIDPGRVAGPVFVAQGVDDPLVPVGLTDRFVRDLCTAGAEVVYERYDGADHGSVLGAGASDIATWLAARVAGERAGTTCD